jgi:TusA-related sulfurtransferase
MHRTESRMRQILDLKGLKCPMPALKTAKLLARIASGDEIEVICTDPMSQIDIPHLLQTTGHELVSQIIKADQLTFLIRKS